MGGESFPLLTTPREDTTMYKIDPQVINATLQYLSSRPYAEVVELINALKSGELEEEISEERVVDPLQ